MAQPVDFSGGYRDQRKEYAGDALRREVERLGFLRQVDTSGGVSPIPPGSLGTDKLGVDITSTGKGILTESTKAGMRAYLELDLNPWEFDEGDASATYSFGAVDLEGGNA